MYPPPSRRDVDSSSGAPPTHLVRDLGIALLGAVALAVALYVGSAYLPSATPLELMLLEAGAVALVGYLVARAFTSAARRFLRTGRLARHASSVALFINTLIGVGVLLTILLVFHVAPESVFLGSAFAAVVLGLASQTVLANLFAGFLIVLAQPFRPGERISMVSSSYGAIWPSYPHELIYPTYTGVVRDISLFYTVLELDSGRWAKVPNSVVLSALIVNLDPTIPRSQRVRMTLPLAVSPELVRDAARALAASPLTAPGSPGPQVQIADVSPQSWDAVIVLWTREPDEDRVRDAVLGEMLPRLAPATAAPTGRARRAA